VEGSYLKIHPEPKKTEMMTRSLYGKTTLATGRKGFSHLLLLMLVIQAEKTVVSLGCQLVIKNQDSVKGVRIFS